MTSQVNVAVVGLGFGQDFLPIYQHHPHVGAIGIAEPNEELLTSVGDRHGIDDRFAGLDEVLDDDRWDAVHIVAPVHFHAEYAKRVLLSGRHCACAVPMATELEDLHEIVELERSSGKRYMMMETSAYTREYLTAKQMFDDGQLGEITRYRGFHVQNLDGYNDYWSGYPPMKYSTHALSPILALTGSSVTTVRALGSGMLRDDQRRGGFDNPYSSEVGLFSLDNSEAVAEISMSFFRVAREYSEGFDVYGDEMSLEWPDELDGPFRGFRLDPLVEGQRWRTASRLEVATSDHRDRLPEPIRRFTAHYEWEPANGGPTENRLSEHGGSHPHLVDEFVNAMVEDRPAAIGAVVAARWTAPGIVAHHSALAGGAEQQVPAFGDDN